MAVNKPIGDNARKGAVKKRSQTKTTIGGASGWTKRDRSSGEFMAVKRPRKAKKAATKFKGVRIEKSLSSTPRISESRAFLLKNIARSLTGLAGQLERLDAVTRAEVRGDDQVRVEKEAHPAVEVWDGPRKVTRLAREKSNDLQR